MSPGKTFDSRIRECYANMTPAERRLGDVLTSLPGTPAGYSATELAALAGVSKAVTTRFFRSLGYGGFDEFRDELRAAANAGSPAYQPVGDPDVAIDERLQPHLRRESRNLSQTLRGLAPHVLDESAEAVRAAERIFVCGFRNSYLLAGYLARQLQLMRGGVALLPAAGQTLGDDLTALGDGDLFVAIGLRRRVPQLKTLMSIARENGAKCLYLTDPSSRGDRGPTDWVIECEIRGAAPFDSYATAMGVLNLLCAEVFRHDIDGGYRRLREIENLHDALGELEGMS